MTLDWDSAGIGHAPDGSAYVIDTDKARGETRWWFVRHVPEGQIAQRDTRTFATFPHRDNRPLPAGVVIGETDHSERRARHIAESHYSKSGRTSELPCGCSADHRHTNSGRCQQRGCLRCDNRSADIAAAMRRGR